MRIVAKSPRAKNAALGPFHHMLPVATMTRTSPRPSKDSHGAEKQKRGNGEHDQVPRLKQINQTAHSDPRDAIVARRKTAVVQRTDTPAPT